MPKTNEETFVAKIISKLYFVYNLLLSFYPNSHDENLVYTDTKWKALFCIWNVFLSLNCRIKYFSLYSIIFL